MSESKIMILLLFKDQWLCDVGNFSVLSSSCKEPLRADFVGCRIMADANESYCCCCCILVRVLGTDGHPMGEYGNVVRRSRGMFNVFTATIPFGIE